MQKESDKIMSDVEPWIEHGQKVHINAIAKDGKFFDTKTGKEIELKEGAELKMIVPIQYIPEEQLKNHNENKERTLLKKGSNLYFKFRANNEVICFDVLILNDLILESKGDKLGRLKNCKCIVSSKNGKIKELKTDSLNQAFTRASIIVRPENPSHNCNVFKSFYYEGRTLDCLR